MMRGSMTLGGAKRGSTKRGGTRRAAAALVSLLVVASLAAPALVAADPCRPQLTAALTPPLTRGSDGLLHVLGTDQLGRDLLARILYGLRASLLVGAVSVMAAGSLGVGLGLLAGYRGGLVEAVIMRFADLLLSVPVVLLAVAVIAVVGQGLAVLVGVIAATQWMSYARTVRGECLALREREYLEAARAVGAGGMRVVRYYLFPAVWPTVTVLATLNLAHVILLEAGLSYLGLGLPPPAPTLGGILNEGREFLGTAWWITTFPGVAIFLLVLGINLLGERRRNG